MTRLLITADAVGGVWQYATDLARGLAVIGFEPVVAVLGPAPTPMQRRAIEGIDLVETGLPLDWLAADRAAVRAAGEAIAALATERGVDLVQVNAPALASAQFEVPVVAVAHSCVGTWWDAVKGGALPDDLAWRDALTSEGLHRASIVIAPSAAFATATRERHALLQMPVVVHNGRTVATVAAQSAADFVFTAGRLWDPAKNIHVLDRAAAMLPVALLAAGPVAGPNGATITLAHARGLGALDDRAIARHLARRPVFASAAQYEPFGLAVLEAAMSGCALVLADNPTFRELWDGAARFVDPADADGFAAAITALLVDPAARSVAGERARQRAERFTTATMVAAMATIYRSLVPSTRVAA